MLSKTFGKLLNRDGLLITYLRGHRASRHSHMLGGVKDAVKPRGTDEFGNTYYEDRDIDIGNHTTYRWVEYKDYYQPYIMADRIPPGWHGWLNYVHDDCPADGTFHKPFYQKKHQIETSNTPLHHIAPGSVLDPDRLEFAERRAKRWSPPDLVMTKDGKKVVDGKTRNPFEDVVANL